MATDNNAADRYLEAVAIVIDSCDLLIKDASAHGEYTLRASIENIKVLAEVVADLLDCMAVQCVVEDTTPPSEPRHTPEPDDDEGDEEG
jgi:hypothetical protein